MSGRDISISIALVVLGVVMQTAMFGDGRINPFGVAPAVVIVFVLACARYLDAEPALLLGFTGGMLLDLLGASPLGLWAIAYTVMVYIALRFKERADDGPAVIAVGVVGFTLLANALFLVLGTLFGERFFTSTGFIKDMVVPAFYNLAIAAVVFPVVTRLIGDRRRVGWSS